MSMDNQTNSQASQLKAEGRRALSFQISINTYCLWLFLACVSIELVLVACDAVITYGRATDLAMIRRLFNITREDGLASWFAVTQTSFVALTTWTILAVSWRRERRTRRCLAWLFIALFFSYMSMDDGSKFHERIGSAIKHMAETKEDSATAEPSFGDALIRTYPSYGWQLAFLPFFAGAGLFMLVFLGRELRGIALIVLFVTALALYGFAVGLDFIEGMDQKHPLNIHEHIRAAFDLRTYTVRHFSKSLEEFSEMLGTTLLWVVFLLHLAHVAPKIHVEFSPSTSSAPAG